MAQSRRSSVSSISHFLVHPTFLNHSFGPLVELHMHAILSSPAAARTQSNSDLEEGFTVIAPTRSLSMLVRLRQGVESAAVVWPYVWIALTWESRRRFGSLGTVVFHSPESKFGISMRSEKVPLLNDWAADGWGLRIVAILFQETCSDSVHQATVYITNTFRSCGLPRKEGGEVVGCEPIA